MESPFPEGATMIGAAAALLGLLGFVGVIL
jgi:hypothetical protein